MSDVVPSLRVGIDIRPLGGASGRRGVGSYIRGLLSEMTSADGASGGIELVLFGSGAEGGDGLPDEVDGVTRVRLRRPRRAITFWDQAAWFPTLASRRLAVFHSPFYAIPWLRPRRCRVVQTIHDVTPVKYPGTVSTRNERIFRMNFRLARSADRIIVPSEATRRDVVALLSIPDETCVVIPEGCDIAARDIEAADAALPAVRGRLGLSDRRYLLHTGGHDRVKNLGRLIEAFSIIAPRIPDLALVLTGEHGTGTAVLMQAVARCGLIDRVRLPGWIPRTDLHALYRGATSVVYPSISEGFGLPVVEAMTCGTPVVASYAGALPEVAGDACLLVDPGDARGIAAAVLRVLEEPERASEMARRGRERAAGFSWRAAARRTLDLYREMAS